MHNYFASFCSLLNINSIVVLSVLLSDNDCLRFIFIYVVTIPSFLIPVVFAVLDSNMFVFDVVFVAVVMTGHDNDNKIYLSLYQQHHDNLSSVQHVTRIYDIMLMFFFVSKNENVSILPLPRFIY